jgi:hypothetical protein
VTTEPARCARCGHRVEIEPEYFRGHQPNPNGVCLTRGCRCPAFLPPTPRPPRGGEEVTRAKHPCAECGHDGPTQHVPDGSKTCRCKVCGRQCSDD